VLDVTGWRCLVVGGGRVAARRTADLLSAGARVTVVAPLVDPALVGLAGGAAGRGPDPDLAIEERPYRQGEATGYRLVLTATGLPEVDGLVVADASAAGILVNSADLATAGTLSLTSVHRAGPVTVAVSTGGTSPALARWVRSRVAAALPRELPDIAGLLEEARRAAQEAGRPTDSIDWEALLDEQVVPLVEAGRIEEAREALRAAAAGGARRRQGRDRPADSP
jgi:precorrin-2 dehydrogenase/sirohydrochlorin ferrochelatase